MQPSYQIETTLPHVFVRTKILIALPKILKASFIIASRKGILEKYLLQNPKRRRMKMDGIERERVENQVA
jgi:hypothetical protein